MLRRSAAIWFAISVVVLVFTGCGDDDDVTGPGNWLTEVDVPLAMGNQWTYLQSVDVGAFAADTSYVTSKIADIGEIDGLTYYCMKDSAHTGESSPEMMCLRQQGGAVYVYPALASEPPEDPVEHWFYEVLTGSVPWKFTDANAAPGTSWFEYDDTRTFGTGEQQFEIEISMKVERLEDEAVTVPAGSWEAYRATLHQKTTVSMGSEQEESVIHQTIYVVDDVGVVRQETEVTSDFPGDQASVHVTDVLVEYSLR